MSRYRASDEALDREIETVERIARLRVRRTIAELRELERDLRELKREKARRKAEQAIVEPAEAPVGEETASSTDGSD